MKFMWRIYRQISLMHEVIAKLQENEFLQFSQFDSISEFLTERKSPTKVLFPSTYCFPSCIYCLDEKLEKCYLLLLSTYFWLLFTVQNCQRSAATGHSGIHATPVLEHEPIRFNWAIFYSCKKLTLPQCSMKATIRVTIWFWRFYFALIHKFLNKWI